MGLLSLNHRQARFWLLMGLGLIGLGMALLFTPVVETTLGRIVLAVIFGAGLLDAGFSLAWFVAHPIRRKA